MFRGLVFALVASLALSTSAFAGGGTGGAKKDSTIKVVNDFSTPYAVVIDAPDSLKAKLAGGTATLADLTAAGGKVVDPGKDASFKVKAGAHKIGFASVNTSTGEIGFPDEAPATAVKGKTVSFNLSAL